MRGGRGDGGGRTETADPVGGRGRGGAAALPADLPVRRGGRGQVDGPRGLRAGGAPWPRDDFPRVHVEATFRRVLALGAPFVMRVAVGKLGRTSIRFDFQVYADEAKQELAVEGSMTVVVVENDKPVEIPAALRAALAPGGNKA